MKCEDCKHWGKQFWQDGDDCGYGFGCGLAGISPYESDWCGCTCKFDPDLKDLFEPKDTQHTANIDELIRKTRRK